jgi:hypothetical protein
MPSGDGMGEAFQGRLLNGERVVWEGQPASGLLLTARDTFLIPFSLLWCGFAIFWEFSVVSGRNAPGFLPLFGLFFVLTGLYFVVGRFFVDAWARGNTVYAVTSQRILILRSAPFSRFTSLAINRLPELSLDERADGRGTIRFQPQVPMWGNRNWSGWTPGLDRAPQFLAVADARNVFDRIQKLSAA